MKNDQMLPVDVRELDSETRVHRTNGNEILLHFKITGPKFGLVFSDIYHITASAN